jgi:protein-S-isoprenylcysteine O-methyltransferase Ste14
MNFSYWPEARQLVVRGPYRFVRHPVYLAEIVMSSAVLLSSMRVTLVVGEFVVIILQLVRIRAEEGLLAGTFPIFRAFQTMTPYRLIPGLW